MAESPTFPRLQDRLMEPVQVVDRETGKTVTIARGDFSPRRHRRLEAVAAEAAAAGEAPAGFDLTQAPDVGDKTAEAVLGAGYLSLEQLAEANARTLSFDAGISRDRARSLIEWAREQLAARDEGEETPDDAGGEPAEG